MTMERRSWRTTFCVNCAAVQSGGVLGFKTSFWVLWEMETLKGDGIGCFAPTWLSLGSLHPVALWRYFVRQSPPVVLGHCSAWELSGSQGSLSHKVLLVRHSFFLSRPLLKTFSRWRPSCEGKMLWSGTAVPSLGCSAVVGGCRQPLNQAQHCNTALVKEQY